MENTQIAAIFREIADILEIQGANVFRIRSYRKAAQMIENYPYSMKDKAKLGRAELEAIPGVGKDLAQKIIEIVTTQQCEMHQRLLTEINPEVLKMLDIRGLGPKKVRLFMVNLGIDTIAKLKKAAETNQLQELPKMGAKSEAEILKAIGELERYSGRMLLHTAFEVAEGYISYMQELKTIQKIQFAGSLRRGRETVGDIDLLAITPNVTEAMNHFVNFEEVENILAQGDTKSSVILNNGVQVDLRIVAAESFGAALHYFTGSKAHNIQIRSRAIKMGMKVNEYGIFKVEGEQETYVAGSTEEELFAALELEYIPPQLREGRGEIEAAEKNNSRLPNLIQHCNLKGDLHLHSDWSDGKDKLEDLAAEYKKAGFEYIAVTDHSPALTVANGLTVERLLTKNKDINALNQTLENFTLLKGSEVDIMADGSLDYADEILAQLDVVVASIHNRFQLSEQEQTARIIKAIENPHVKIIGHLHGRLIGKREGYQVDIKKIMEAAKEHDVAIEINSQPLRLDILDHNCILAKEMGVKIVINSDAHYHPQMAFLKLGTLVAQRGWLEAENVVNTFSLTKLRKWLALGR